MTSYIHRFRAEDLFVIFSVTGGKLEEKLDITGKPYLILSLKSADKNDEVSLFSNSYEEKKLHAII